jgi:xylulokinase
VGSGGGPAPTSHQTGRHIGRGYGVERREVSLGIDLGTSGVKVALVDAQGTPLAVAHRPFAVSSPHHGWAETPPAQWAAATREAVAEVLSQCPDVRVMAVGIDGQMHGVVLVRGATPVRDAILWPDSRAVAELALWRAVPEAVRATLANPLTAGMAGPVLAWLARHEPEAIQAADTMVAPKDWLRMQLVPGEPVTDPSDASATLLWDVVADDWCAPVVAAAGIEARLLPHVWPSTAPIGTLAQAEASAWGLPVGIPVSVGCGDAAATLVGASPGSDQLIVTVGTGIQVISPRTKPQPDAMPSHHTFASATGDYYAMAAPMNGGLALARVREVVCAGWAELYGSLDSDPDEVGSVVFLPYFAAERLPRPVPSGSAGWHGLGLDSGRNTLLRSSLESVAFLTRRAVATLPGSAVAELRLVGGGTRDRRFQQLLADVLGRSVQRCRAENVTALGAARLGWAAFGHEVTGAEMELEDPVDPSETFDYDPRFDRFQELTEELVS